MVIRESQNRVSPLNFGCSRWDCFRTAAKMTWSFANSVLRVSGEQPLPLSTLFTGFDSPFTIAFPLVRPSRLNIRTFQRRMNHINVKRRRGASASISSIEVDHEVDHEVDVSCMSGFILPFCRACTHSTDLLARLFILVQEFISRHPVLTSHVG